MQVKTFIVPISENDSNPEQQFQDFVQRLNTKYYVVSNIRIATVTIPENIPESFKLKDGESTFTQINSELDKITGSKKPLSLLNEAKIQIHLGEFFINNKFRDPAYISIENAKQALALAAEQKNTDKRTIDKLVERITALEIQLHKDMPFTL